MAKEKIPCVLVATPAYDGKVDTDYSQSLAEAAFFSAIFAVKFTACVMGNGAFIELNRNIMVQKFLADKDLTHLFFIDADLKFPYHAFLNLILADRPICAGVYRRRQEPEDYPATWADNPEIKGPDGEPTLWVEDETWLKCTRVPTGFLCIRRDVLEEMAKDCQTVSVHGHPPLPWLFETKLEGGKFVGEDFTFCDKYFKKYGTPIDVLPDIDFVHGGYKGNFAKYLSKQVEGYKALKGGKRKLGAKRDGAISRMRKSVAEKGNAGIDAGRVDGANNA